MKPPARPARVALNAAVLLVALCSATVATTNLLGVTDSRLPIYSTPFVVLGVLLLVRLRPPAPPSSEPPPPS